MSYEKGNIVVVGVVVVHASDDEDIVCDYDGGDDDDDSGDGLLGDGQVPNVGDNDKHLLPSNHHPACWQS